MKLEFSQQTHNKTTSLFRQEHNNGTLYLKLLFYYIYT